VAADRIAGDLAIAQSGFGADVRDVMERRADHLASAGLARRHGQRIIFARDLTEALRRAPAGGGFRKAVGREGASPSVEGEYVSGVYR